MSENIMKGIAGLKVLAAGRLLGVAAPPGVTWVGPHPGFANAIAYTGVGDYQVTLLGCLANLVACPVATCGTVGAGTTIFASIVRTAAGAYGPPLVPGSLQVLLMQDAGGALDGSVDIMILAV